MSGSISGNVPLRPYNGTTKSETIQRTNEKNGFLDLLAQTRKAQTNTVNFSSRGMTSDLSMDLAAVYSTTAEQTDGVATTEEVSLKRMLKAKYPGLVYHVLDQSSSLWHTHTDYPHYLLYQDGEAAEEKLKNWKPEGADPFYGSTDGKFTAPKEIHALGSLRPRSKAVVIHPKVQERMEQDQEYAKEIFARIDAWFTLGVARNEAIMPGSTLDMSQVVAIGEDGTLVNACSSRAGSEITFSNSGNDGPSWWERRMQRSKELMDLNTAVQIERAMAYSKYLSALSLPVSKEKSQFTSLLMGGDLREIFGNTVLDMPTEDFLALLGSEIGIMM